MADLLKKIAQLSPERRARLLKAARKNKRGRSKAESPMRRIVRSGRYPLSDAQRRIWFATQLEPSNPYYNGPDRLRIVGNFVVTAWHQTLRETERRQEIWRTRYPLRDGVPEQVHVREFGVIMPLIDLSGLEPERREVVAKWIFLVEGKRNFYPEIGPLMQNYVCRFGPEEHEWGESRQHLINDWPGDELMFLDWEQTCRLYLDGLPAALPELERQYVDYAVWHRQWVKGADYTAQLAYWKKQLDGAPTWLGMPTDRQRPAVESYKGKLDHYSVPIALFQQLKRLCLEEGATWFMGQLALVDLVLARWTGQLDISVATQIDTRNRRVLEPIYGFMVNTVVLRTDLRGNPTGRELIRRVRRVCDEAWSNRDVPFQDVVRALGVERYASRSPLIEVFFTIFNNPLQLPQLPGTKVTSDYEAIEKALFDLTLLSWDFGEIFRYTWEYATDLWDPSTMVRFAQHWTQLWRSLVADPDAPIDSLSMLTDGERHQLVDEPDAFPIPHDDRVDHLIKEGAQHHPDATALVWGGEHLTYGELHARAAAVASHLRALGIGPETPVGVSLTCSPQWVVAMLGIASAGGVYVPIDSEQPATRRAFIAEDAAPAVMLTAEMLDSTGRLHEADAPAGSPTDLAYLLYTSGSTGQPKAVAVEHRSLRNHREGFVAATGLRRDDRLLQFAAASFDVSLEEALPALSVGATLVYMDGLLEDPNAALEREAITVLNLPTTLWRTWLGSVSEVPSSVRLMLIGSEKAERRDAEDWERLTGGRVPLRNMYGSTETTITSACHRVTKVPSASSSTTLPIGWPLAGTGGRVVDAAGFPQPIGVSGTLAVHGAGLARGYLNRPGLTAAQFTCQPHGLRAYGTGDQVTVGNEGEWVFVGRADHQIKVRGFRIEPGDVENVLVTHPGIGDVAVRAGEDGRLIAYVVPSENPPPKIDDLRDFAREYLVQYMVPASFVFVDEFPLTPAGRIDPEALPEIGAPERARGEYVAPRNDTEKALAAIVGELLGAERVGVHDNFFTLGGDSMLGIQLLWRIRAQLGLNISLRTLFLSQSIGQLASAAGRG